MKKTNLNSIINSYRRLNEIDFKKYLQHLKIELKEHELVTLNALIDELSYSANFDASNFYVGYKIPQINKEFDLLRFGENHIVNIELKSQFNADAIREQLIKNRKYLNFLNTELHLFCFSSDVKKLYYLDENDILVSTAFSSLVTILTSQKIKYIDDIDRLFHINNFLVSPFNDIDRFINSKYYLTDTQLVTKRSIQKNMDKNKFSIIEAKPGTGKSLVIYDIAKELQADYKVSIIHSGIMNNGHFELKNHHSWNIFSMKNYSQCLQLQPNVIFIDECQRARPSQLKEIIEYINTTEKTHCVFSIDPRQVLAKFEREWNNIGLLESLDSKAVYTLGDSIRTNKELSGFIKGLFNLKYLNYHKNYNKIDLHYFNDMDEARIFANHLSAENFTIIDHTPQTHNSYLISKTVLSTGINAHHIIGQEFDNVCCVIGPGFYYDGNRKLKFQGTNYYDPERMLFQAVTRTKDKLTILFVNVPDVFSKILNAINTN